MGDVSDIDDIIGSGFHKKLMAKMEVPHVKYYCGECRKNHWLDSAMGWRHKEYGAIKIRGRMISALEDMHLLEDHEHYNKIFRGDEPGKED